MRSLPVRLGLLFLILALAFSSACSRRADVKKARFMETGRQFYDKGDYARAIIEWKNATAIANGDPEPFYWLGMGYAAVGNIPLAVDSFRAAVDLNPNHAAAQLRMAELFTLTDDKDLLQDAIKRLQIVLNTSPSGNALTAIALTEIKLGNPEDSQKYLEEALARFPQSLSAYVVLAKLKIMKRDLPGAEEVLRKAIAAAPPASLTASQARLALGDFLQGLGRNQEAETFFRQALDLDKKSGVPLLQLALLEYNTGRKQEAEGLFRQLSNFPDPALMPMHAIYLFKEGDKAGATAEMEKLVRDHPKSLPLRARLLAVYWATRRLDLVEKFLDAALKRNAKDLDALLQRGELYVATERFDKAQADLDKVLALRPEAAVVHYVLAKMQQGRGAEASYRQELEEALRLNPGLLNARLDLAKRLTEINAPESALKLLEEAPSTDRATLQLIAERNWALLASKNYDELQKNLKSELEQARTPELLVQDGWLKIRQRDYAAARVSLEEGLTKAPSDTRVLAALASLYLAQNKPAEFTQRIRQYAGENHSAEVQFFAGEWMRQNGDWSGARSFLEAAKKADPGFYEANLALAALDMQEGKLDSARATLNQMVTVRDKDVSLRVRIAHLEITRNQVSEAINQYRQILAIDKGNIYALNNLAYLLAQLNQPDEALAYAQQAKELAPTLPEVEDTLGWVLYHKAIYGEAVTYLESAAKNKSDPSIQYHLGLALYKTGKSERGAQILKAALKAAPNLPEAELARRTISQ